MEYVPGHQNIAGMCARSSLNWIKGAEIVYELENNIYLIEIDDQFINFGQILFNCFTSKINRLLLQ